MKKIIITLLILSISCVGFAKIGKRYGISANTVNAYMENDDFDLSSNLSFGISAITAIEPLLEYKTFSLGGRKEISIFNRSFDDFLHDGDNYSTMEIQSTSIAKFFFLKNIPISVDSGLFFSWIFSSEYESDILEIDESDLNRFNWGLHLGLTYEINRQLYINMRIQEGFRELFENSDIKRSMLNLGIGYFFEGVFKDYK